MRFTLPTAFFLAFSSFATAHLGERNSNRNLSTNAFAKNYDLMLGFNEVTFLTAHNSNADSSFNIVDSAFANQRLSMDELITQEQTYGHMIDIIYDTGRGEWRFTHGEQDFDGFVERTKKELLTPLLEDDTLILWFDVQIDKEDGQNDDDLKRLLSNAFDQMPEFRDLIFNIKDSRWSNHQDWPTLLELVEAQQRVVMIVDREELAGQCGNGYLMYKEHVTMENMFGTLDKDSCEQRHKFDNDKTDADLGKDWTRLFTMNHFPKIGQLFWYYDHAWDSVSIIFISTGTKNDIMETASILTY
jgi:hypothetical protein